MYAMSMALHQSELGADVEWVEEKCLAALKDYGKSHHFEDGSSKRRLVETGQRLMKLSEWTLAEDEEGSVWVEKHAIGTAL